MFWLDYKVYPRFSGWFCGICIAVVRLLRK